MRISGLGFPALLASAVLRAAGPGWDFEQVRKLAAERASRPFDDPPPALPSCLTTLGYDELRCIEYRREQAIWHAENLPFRLMMYHLGGPHLPHGVALNVVAGGESRPLPFQPSYFLYHEIAKKVLPSDLTNVTQFAGVRALCRLNAPDRFDELISFLGASYFRALGRDLVYGSSARGFYIDRNGAEPEEFPRFVAFWADRPAPGDNRLDFLALLDGASVCGAFGFRVTPGEDTTVAVRAALYARRPLSRYGLGPLTSMYWHGETGTNRFGDFRPEVHDADGLLIQAADGSWIWRPLRNDPCLRVAEYPLPAVRGFGLLQRDRRYTSYEDIEARYHRRPSVWVEPGAGWGAGRVRLLEWPTHTEYADNIVACWQPDRPLEPGRPQEVFWTLHWYADNPAWPPLARAVNSFVTGRRVRLDFAGPGLPADDRGPAPLADIVTDNGRVSGLHVTRGADTGWWRAGFDVVPDEPWRCNEVQAVLRDAAGRALSETWTYQLTP
jgi:glucans biosynthesis protein